MSLFAHVDILILLVAAVANITLGLLVLFRDPKSATSRLFFLLILSMMLWGFCNFLSYNNTNTLLLARLVLFFAVPFATFFYLFVQTFPSHRLNIRGSAVVGYLILSLLAMAITLSPLAFKQIESSVGKGVVGQPIVGPGIGFFGLVVVFYDLGGLIVLIGKTLHSRGEEKMQRLYLFFGVSLMLSMIIAFEFILPTIFGNTRFIPFATAFTFPFVAFTTYAIVKHRLLDIRAVVARSVTYVLLLATMAFLYGAIIFGLYRYLLPSSLSTTPQTIVNIILAIILAFTFQPLRRFFERITDRVFFRDRYDSQELLNKIGKELASELLLEKLLDGVLEELCTSLRIQYGQFFIFNKGKIYKVAHYGPLPDRLIVVPELKKLRQRIMVADELDGTAAKAVMDEHGIRLSMILRTKEEFVGFLLLGDKLSGDIYSDQDLKLLDILSSELAVAIVNAKAYEEISQFNLTLQDKVNEATKRLRAANTTLRSLDKAKDEFISMASHQLRTPLTTIKGYLSMVLEGDTGKITKEQREFLNYAFGGSERMVGLISDLLNVSRLAAGRFMIDRSPTDVVAVAADEVRQLETHAESKGLALKFEVPKTKFPMIELDENKTRQVMMNFIDNAVYYTKEGSVTVTLELDKPKGVVRFCVRDTGIGVPKDAQKKLFAKFYRAGNAQNVRPDGTGLGLYLAKRVIEDQGGTILFESEEGKGSMFGFELPLVPKPLPATKSAK